MGPEFSRIRSVVSVDTLQTKHVVVVGLGGAVTLTSDLARSGVAQFTLCDFDVIDSTNVARQDHFCDRVGMLKVDAVAEQLLRINPAIRVHRLPVDFCTLSDEQVQTLFATADLFLFATDSFPAQARGNQVALLLGKPAVWVGLYAGGVAGEVIFWHPELDACFRCLCCARYDAYEQGLAPPVTSDGASILDIRWPDALAGTLTLGLLTRGAENRYGRLIDQLGARNFFQIKIDPTYAWNGRDLFREQLQVPADCRAYFSYVTIARSDPDHGQLPCPDCETYRGHRFVTEAGASRRIRPGDSAGVNQIASMTSSAEGI